MITTNQWNCKCKGRWTVAVIKCDTISIAKVVNVTNGCEDEIVIFQNNVMFTKELPVNNIDYEYDNN